MIWYLFWELYKHKYPKEFSVFSHKTKATVHEIELKKSHHSVWFLGWHNLDIYSFTNGPLEKNLKLSLARKD